MTTKYNIVTDDGEPSSAAVFTSTGRMLVATKEHKGFPRIIEALRGGSTEEDIIGLFDAQVGIATRFNKVSDRVSIRNGEVFFDGMKQEGVLTDLIIQFHAHGLDDFMSLVNFMENIETNPNPHSRQHLFRWLRSGKFSITGDGMIVAYKGVERATGLSPTDECFTSVHSGPAIVNGDPMNGQIPNRPGTIIEMARDEVTFDPKQLCSRGLHVADWSYAKTQMGTGYVVQVLINPRDVVSVPEDHSDKKMRVCRYRVMGVVTKEDDSLLHVDKATQMLTARFVELKPPAPKPPATVKKAATKKAAVNRLTTKKVATKRLATKKVAVAKAAPAKKGAPVKKAAPAKLVKAPALPKYYEEFTRDNFATLPYAKLVWLAKQWDLKPADKTTATHIAALTKAAKARLKKVNRPSDKTKTA